MRTGINRAMKPGVSLVLLGLGLSLIWAQTKPGKRLDSFRGVAVYDNGPVLTTSHGRHFSADGYYFGQKWQCVEFVKRFFYKAYGHRMPDVWGHARDFFDESISQGELNQRRGLLQFRNGANVAPRAGDLLVFTNGTYGHVAIVSDVKSNRIEVIQQNIPGHTRDQFSLTKKSGKYEVGNLHRPAGWLRLPPKK